MNWTNILERAGWTAVQGGLSAIPVAQVTAAISDVDISSMEQLALVGLGGAVASLLSFIKTVAQARLKELG